MGYFHFDENGLLMDPNGEPLHLVGINYVASYCCTNFWEDWRPDRIEADLKSISEMDLKAVRIPMHWGFIEPEEGKYNPVFLERFQAFLDMCKKYSLYIMPWFLVGVATRDYDVPFRCGRPFFTGSMVTAAKNHLQYLVAKFKDDPQILFWDICDEPEWYSRNIGAEQLPYDKHIFAQWVKTMYEAIKEVDPNHLVTLGFGHIANNHFGFDVQEMANVLDLMVVTAYSYYGNEGLDTQRKNYGVPFHVKMNSRGKPVFTCEAPGFSSCIYADAVIGRYYKTSIYSNYINGSTGVLPWVYNDFEESIWQEPPLDKYLVEPYFGIVTVDGHLKPAGEELRKFAKYSKKYAFGKYRPVAADVGILVPDGYYGGSVDQAANKLYISMLLAKGCSGNVDFVWYNEDFSQYKLLVIPASTGMTSITWNNVQKYVASGGNVYLLFNGWDTCSAYFNNLCGIEVETTERDFGEAIIATEGNGIWPAGHMLDTSSVVRGSRLSVFTRGAQVLAQFEDGVPALLHNCYGKGNIWLSTLELEAGLMDARMTQFRSNCSFEIYEALFEACGVQRWVTCSDCAVEIGCMEQPVTNKRIVICLNHSKTEIKTKLSVNLPDAHLELLYADGCVVTGDELCFEAAGVAVFHI